MNGNQAIISAAMLEATWESRKKDMLDLVAPFVMYATATLTSPGKKINIPNVLKYVRENFAYKDMPESIVKRVLSRNPYSAIKKEKGDFYLIGAIDDEIEKMNMRKEKCEQYLCALGEKLGQYLISHCEKTKDITSEQAIKCLHSFFSRYGLEIGTDDLASVSFSPEEYEIDYYIARFIFECKDEEKAEYQYLNDLIKGYFLRLAIYMQPENGSLTSANYNSTTFFYDTPFLLDLLGYSNKEREENAKLLHSMLKKQNGKFCYFPQTRQEIINILSAYKYSLSANSTTNGARTLEGLNAKGFSGSDVEREITWLQSKLENMFTIVEHELPVYIQKADGTVDETKVLGESEIQQYIRENTTHYAEDNLKNDVTSALAIHRLRGDSAGSTIENCRVIFVTNNYDFMKLFNAYYKKNVCGTAFPPIILDSTLSAITWIKAGEVENLPESELLKNAYSAMQPNPEIMVKVEEVLQKLKQAGKIKPEQVATLRVSRVFQHEIWKETFGDVESVTEVSVQEAQKAYEQQLIEGEVARHKEEESKIEEEYKNKIAELNGQMNAMSEEHSQKISEMTMKIREQEVEAQRREHEHNEKIRVRADQYAKQERKKWISHKKLLLQIVLIILSIIGGVGAALGITVYSNIVVTIIMGITTIISIVSIVQTVYSQQSWINRIIEKCANKFETQVRERKLQEYRKLNENEQEKIMC